MVPLLPKTFWKLVNLPRIVAKKIQLNFTSQLIDLEARIHVRQMEKLHL